MRSIRKVSVPGVVTLHCLLEDIICEPLPSVSKLTRGPNGIDLERDEPFEKSDILLAVQGSILEFAQVFADSLGKYLPFLEFDRFGLFDMVADIMSAPTKKDAELIKILKFHDSSFLQDKMDKHYDDYYLRWYKHHFPQKTVIKSTVLQNTHLPLKERLRIWGYHTAEKLGVLEQARRAYRFFTKRPSVENEFAAEVDADLSSFKANVYLAKDNNVVLIGDIHPAARKAINTMTATVSDYNWIYLTNEQSHVYEKFSCIVRPIPRPLVKNAFSAKVKFKITDNIRNRIRSSEVLKLTASRMYRAYPNSGKGFPEFFVCETERYFEGVFQFLKPRAVFLWNRYQTPNCVIDSIAKRLGIPVAYVESGAIPGTFMIDNEGQLGESWVSREPEKFLSLPVENTDLHKTEALIQHLCHSGANRYVQPQSDTLTNILSRIDKKKFTVFLAGDYDPESGIYPFSEHSREYNSPMFESSYKAMLFIAELARKNQWNFIYKPHPISLRWPFEPDKYPSNVIFIGEGDINEIIDAVDLVVGLIGSVTYTALIRSKPALPLGYTPLKGKGCAYEAYSLGEIEPVIKTALEQGYTEAQKQAFIKHIAQMNKYYWFDNTAEKPMPYGRNMEETVRFLRDVIDGKPIIHGGYNTSPQATSE